jgi:hypothetical protein
MIVKFKSDGSTQKAGFKALLVGKIIYKNKIL